MLLYDTARRAVVPFEPNDIVTMYTCGITPYDATHLGHAATFIFYDVLQRRLIDKGHTVKCVRNVTDVDDPLFAKARQLGVHYLDLAAGEEARFERDMEALNALPVVVEPASVIGHSRHPRFHRDGSRSWLRLPGRRERVLRRIEVPLVRIDRQLLARADDRVRPRAWRQHRRPAQARTHSTSCCGTRRLPTSRAGTRCGGRAGRAGTSSARRLALRELGTTIDLHGGGTDLIFPHHECERAQSEAATGEPFVRHWMHTAMVYMDGQKMSKSLGNLVFVDALRKEWDPRAIRLAIIEHHYRLDWEWDDTLMPRNAQRLAQLVRSGPWWCCTRRCPRRARRRPRHPGCRRCDRCCGCQRSGCWRRSSAAWRRHLTDADTREFICNSSRPENKAQPLVLSMGV